MIYLGSRYENEPVEYLLDGRTGRTRATVMRSPADTTETYPQSKRWYDGTRLDLMAFHSVGDSELWYTIVDRNSEVLDPMSLFIGESILVP